VAGRVDHCLTSGRKPEVDLGLRVEWPARGDRSCAGAGGEALGAVDARVDEEGVLPPAARRGEDANGNLRSHFAGRRVEDRRLSNCVDTLTADETGTDCMITLLRTAKSTVARRERIRVAV